MTDVVIGSGVLCGPDGGGIDPQNGEVRQAQIFVAVLAASSLTFALASFGQRLPDWIKGQTRALSYFGGVPKAIVCDNLKAGVVKALWFEPTLNQTFAAMAEHDDTTILPTRSPGAVDAATVVRAPVLCERLQVNVGKAFFGGRPPYHRNLRGRFNSLRGLREGSSLAFAESVIPSKSSRAFLAPSLVKAALEGRLPRGIGIAKLRDVTPAWSKQYNKLGLLRA